MIKTKCGQILLEDRKIFTALQRNIDKEKNQAEQHLMDMLCASGFQRDGEWGYRQLEPKKTSVVSVAMVMPGANAASAPAQATRGATSSTSSVNVTKAANGSVVSTDKESSVAVSGEESAIEDMTASSTTGQSDDQTQTAAAPPPPLPPGSQQMTDLQRTIQEQNQVQMAIAQKLLLFWRKPARKCWWDMIQVEIDQDMEGAKVPVRLWARRTWTLELVIV
ncbi:hypothetical protein BGZ65_005836 [Modicella reniformis]|uniref:Uncharacterized protein n=1 Tax=Modicella reniformis TaxID=1440133 RepID=A0A9P6MG84_9FUNG|nr:hypothetical protein BGZ65_005836 [Modicella reniformis]